MKLLLPSVLLLLIFTSSSFAQVETRSLEKNAIDVAVADLRIEANNINQLLAKIAYKYSVPMSLEVATDEDLSKSTGVTVQLKKGTLSDVLDNIVSQKPSYTWEASGATIRVFPKTDLRDPLLQTLLETSISHFVVQRSTLKLSFREALTQRPELKNLLASYGVRPSNEGFSRFDVEPFGGDFALDLENASVRSILDDVIKNSRTKYWFINRDGEKREYLLINF